MEPTQAHFTSKIMRAVLYCCAGENQQGNQWEDLRVQEAELREYCDRNSIEVVTSYLDGETGSLSESPGLQALLQDVASKNVSCDVVLVVSWDRFSRDLTEALTMSNQLQAEGIHVVATRQAFEPAPEAAILRAPYMSSAEVGTGRRAFASRKELRERQQAGDWISHPPKGYQRVTDSVYTTTLAPDQNAAFVTTAFEQVAKGDRPWRDILQELQAEGFACSPNQFLLALRNPVYGGKIQLPRLADGEAGEMIDGLHPALISIELFNQVQKVLDDNNRLPL